MTNIPTVTYPIPQQNKNALIGHIHISITVIIGRIERAIKGSRFESRYDYPVLGSSTLSLTIPLYAPGQSSRRKVKEGVIRSSVKSVCLQEIRPIGDPPAVENSASDSIPGARSTQRSSGTSLPRRSWVTCPTAPCRTPRPGRLRTAGRGPLTWDGGQAIRAAAR